MIYIFKEKQNYTQVEDASKGLICPGISYIHIVELLVHSCTLYTNRRYLFFRRPQYIFFLLVLP